MVALQSAGRPVENCRCCCQLSHFSDIIIACVCQSPNYPSEHFATSDPSESTYQIMLCPSDMSIDGFRGYKNSGMPGRVSGFPCILSATFRYFPTPFRSTSPAGAQNCLGGLIQLDRQTTSLRRERAFKLIILSTYFPPFLIRTSFKRLESGSGKPVSYFQQNL